MISKQYLAGFFDGEGHVYFRRNKYNKIVYRLEIAQKEAEVLNQIKQKYGGIIKLIKRDNTISKLTIYRITDILSTLHDIVPFLIVKKKKAQSLLDYIQNKKKIQLKNKIRMGINKQKRKEFIANQRFKIKTSSGGGSQ